MASWDGRLRGRGVASMVCVNVRELPLQMALRDCPEGREAPMVVVDRKKPTGRVLWANERARSCRILPGMRYVAGLSLASDLLAAVISGEALERERARLTRRLGRFSPSVEPSRQEPGVFWLDVSRLRCLDDSWMAWAQSVEESLRLLELSAVVVVGWTRFGVYAVSKAAAGSDVLLDAAQERQRMRSVALDRLHWEPKALDALTRLGITTVGAFMDLPALGLRKRFGELAYGIHQQANGQTWNALTPSMLREPLYERVIFEAPEESADRLLVFLEPRLLALLEGHRKRGQALSVLRLRALLDDGTIRDHRLNAAEPTLDGEQWVSLLRLRFESMAWSSGVNECLLQGVAVGVTGRQEDLFEYRPNRDRQALARAYARIRAEWGDRVLYYARLKEGHLPQSQFEWVPFEGNVDTEPLPTNAELSVARRVFRPARRLPLWGTPKEGTVLVLRDRRQRVVEIVGPYRVEGAWWLGAGVARDFYYWRLEEGRWLWVFYDQRRRGWFQQGEVE